jgi:hypothetical protein
MRIIQFIEREITMRKIIITIVFTLCLLIASATQAQQCQRITFQRGQTSAVVKGQVSAARSVCYKLHARNGRRLIAHLTSPDRRVRFSISPDYYDADFLARGYNVTDWDGELESPAGDDFMIMVTLSAKKITDTYTLEVNIPTTASANTTRRANVEPCGNFSGTYQTNYGPLRLTRTGDQVRGAYTTDQGQNSTLSGTVRGNVLSGRWTEPGTKGTFKFTLDSDGRSFTGRFFVDGDPNGAGEWGGHCGDDR